MTQEIGTSKQRRIGALIVGMAIGVVIGVGIFQVWFGNHQAPDTTAIPRFDEVSAALADLQVVMQTREIQLEQVRAGIIESEQKTAFLSGVLGGEWKKVAEILNQLPRDSRAAFLENGVPQLLGRGFYLEGLRFSREGRYFEAEPLLHSAIIIGPSDCYYRDDAVYFRARALQRTNDLRPATEAFELLLTQYPDSPYVDDAEGFLREIPILDSAVGGVNDR